MASRPFLLTDSRVPIYKTIGCVWRAVFGRMLLFRSRIVSSSSSGWCRSARRRVSFETQNRKRNIPAKSTQPTNLVHIYKSWSWGL